MDDMKLTIKGLFGHFDYEIPLYGLSDADSFPVSDGVTILTGPNGYGKTTILRMLEAISKGDLDFFITLNFQSLTLRREDSKNNLTLEKGQNRFFINGASLLFEDIRLKRAGVTSRSSDSAKYKVYINEERVPRLIGLITKALSCKVLMISEQRLLDVQNVTVTQNGERRELQEVTATIDALPSRLITHFLKVSQEYSKVDNRLNASFPRRVLSQSDDSDLTHEEFDRFYQDMNAKLRVLQENGISEFVQQDIPKFQAGKAGILRVFFDDFNEKYTVYEPLVRKLTLFRKILDRRFRRFKCVEISREYGLRVRDSGGDVIPLEKLSSGEQETLVLYYQLIFETAPGTMLLIDEPEISLHIAWQRHFIDELKEIVRLNGLRAVVATHSTSIIGRHRDIQVDLGALYQDELDRQRAQQG